MTDTNTDVSHNKLGKMAGFLKSRDGWTLCLAFAVSCITSIFMVRLLPELDVMGAFGVLFIYFVSMIIMAGVFRMIMGFYDKFSKRRT